MIEIRVPASTSNLGSGFDAIGLALKLYLKMRVQKLGPDAASHKIDVMGEDADLIPTDDTNMAVRALALAGEREGIPVPRLHLVIENQIPVARGLGGSGAAIIAGLTAFEAITGCTLGEEKVLTYAFELEGHADNVAPSVMGSLVATCLTEEGKIKYLQSEWPRELKIIAVVPSFHLSTKTARSILPSDISLKDAVFNLQRAVLLWPALMGRRYDLVREAMKDRVHQPYRQNLVPGLAEALQIREMDGLVGVALSGAGPTIIALASSNFQRIGQEIVSCFEKNQVAARILILDADPQGRTVSRVETDTTDALKTVQ
jgi:homoserine kinase